MIENSKTLFNFATKASQDIKDCITDYIKYIVTLTSATGFISFLINDEITIINRLFIIVFVLVGVTFFFEIIWYKFKSNNRYEGLNNLLSEEENCINYNVIKDKDKKNPGYIEKREYIKDYSNLSKNNDCKIQEDVSSFGLYISRYNDNKLHKYKYNPKLKRDTSINSVSKSKYVFAVPKKYHKFIEINKYDQRFFKKIIWELYGDRIYDSRNEKFTKTFIDFFRSIGFLFSDNSSFIRSLNIDKRYISSGWKYPKKITQIAYLSILSISAIFLYYLSVNYNLDFSIINNNTLPPFALFIVVAIINLWWLLRYVIQLKDIIYGKHSIDGYCWNFFTYRVQDLNIKDAVPIYYSRSFIRFFKTNLYIKYLSNFQLGNPKGQLLLKNEKKCTNEITKTCVNEISKNINIIIEKADEKIVIEIIKNILDYDIGNTNYVEYIEQFFNTNLIENYVSKLTNYKSFKKEERVLHKVIVYTFKLEYDIKD